MPIRLEPRFVVEKEVRCRASFNTSVVESKRIFEFAGKTKCVTGTVVTANVSVFNTRRQRSVTIDWTIQSRIKRVTLKIINIKVRKASSKSETEETDEIEPARNESINNKDIGSCDEPVAVTPTAQINYGEGGDIVVHKCICTTKEVSYPLNGRVPSKNWKVVGRAGNVLTHGNAPRDLTPYDFFMYSFSIKCMQVFVRLTNKKMESKDDHVIIPVKIMNFLGTLVLMLKFNVGSKRDL